MELSEAIDKIIQEFGKDIIAEKRFVYMIADYYSFRDNPAEKRVLSALVNDGYTARLLNLNEGIDVSIITNQIVEEVCRNYGFREKLVKSVLSCLVIGSGVIINNMNNCNPVIAISIEESIDEERVSSPYLFYLKKVKRFILGKCKREEVLCDAVGHYNNDGTFVIHKGSLLSIRTENQRAYVTEVDGELRVKYMNHRMNFGNGYLIRKKILEQHCSLQKSGYYLVDTDITCTTPSEAAFVATLSDLNGMIVWKDINGKTLKQYIKE